MGRHDVEAYTEQIELLATLDRAVRAAEYRNPARANIGACVREDADDRPCLPDALREDM
jgi:hypothetical protein